MSHYDPAVYSSYDEWARRKDATPVRIQWDPERSLRLEPLAHRSIQIGLADEATHRYVDEWIVSIADITPLVREIHDLVTTGELTEAKQKLPPEQPYPLSSSIMENLGAT